MEIFYLKSITPPWGDYGRILLNGMSARLPRVQGRIQLERTGPFLPHLTFPRRSDVLITEAARENIEERFGPIPVQAVDKARIVRLDWAQWNRAASVPPIMPTSGSPENYILDGPHDPALADELGPIWEMQPTTIGRGTSTRLGKRATDSRVTIAVPQPLAPLFRVAGLQLVFVRQDVAAALREITGDTFELGRTESA